MTDDLVKRLLWHVEQVLGPVSDEPIVNEHDSDKAVLLFNFQAETKRANDYWYRQGRDDQYATHADRIETLTAENERLREALAKIADGTMPRPLGEPWRMDMTSSKHDRCVHGAWMYEPCEGCIDAFIASVLGGANG